MHQLIITRILKRGTVTLSELEHRATERGVSLSELYAALEQVHKDKRIQQTVNSKGEVTYKPAIAKRTPKPPFDPWTPELRAYSDSLTAPGTPIPFYWPEQDGDSPVYGEAYSRHLREKNRALKRQVEESVYNKRNGKQGKCSTEINP